jgi:hypothetical protein
MYKQTPAALSIGTVAGGALHNSGTNIIWTIVLAATIAGIALAIGRIALSLGAPHPSTLLANLRHRRRQDEPTTAPGFTTSRA